MATNLSQQMSMDSDSGTAQRKSGLTDPASIVTRQTYLFAFCAALNSCNLGYDIGVSTNAGSLIQRDLGLTDVQKEMFIGSLNLWSIFGSLFAHWICDRYGRRLSFVVAAVGFIVGLVVMAIAGSYTVLMIGRVFVGLGVGFGLAIDPLYIAEISPAPHRGRLVTWSELALNVGILFGFLAGLIFYDFSDNVEWRMMFAMGCILPVIMIFLVRTVMPESPRYLVANGRDDEAKNILKQLYAPGVDIEPVVYDIKEAIERERVAEKAVGWRMIFFPTPAIRRMLIVGVGTAIAQQAVGIDAIQYYLLDVIKESGIESEKSQLVVLMMLGVLKLSFIVVGGRLFDTKGRKPLLYASLGGMAIALVLTSVSFFGGASKGSAWAIGGLSLYLSFFSIGMGPGAWLIPSEVFATSIRAKAMSMATFFNRITATIMASTFLSVVGRTGWGAFFVALAVVCSIVALFFYMYLPETKGHTLEDMSVYFAEITGDESILEAEKQVQRDMGHAVEMPSVTAADEYADVTRRGLVFHPHHHHQLFYCAGSSYYDFTQIVGASGSGKQEYHAPSTFVFRFHCCAGQIHWNQWNFWVLMGHHWMNLTPPEDQHVGKKEKKEEEEEQPDPPRNFTKQQLLHFDGKKESDGDDDKPVYLSVNGIVFDVSSARNFYGPGGPYEAFAGHECGAALAKMSFDTVLLDDMGACKKLNFGEKTELEGWIEKFTYYRNYPIKGRLVPDDVLEALADRVLSKEELARFSGREGDEVPEGYATAPIYVGAGNKVFDASFGGVEFYGAGGGYNRFAGKDVSRALAKMSFDPADVENTSVDDLEDKQKKVLADWIKTFEERKKYPIVGKLEKY
eukprot:Nitzschia sp. Nitz4//scaffold58_size112336//36048//38913//NITZ4_004026-RA/size112336-processed-gene-0.63-mRNA-1//1//CDS//3329554968//7397//frame0